MKTLRLIGIGAGHLGHITVDAIRALNQTDVFFVLDKGEAAADLRHMREAVCEQFIEVPMFRTVVATDPVRRRLGGSYREDVEAWHRARADIFERLLRDELAEGESGAFLVWGDPSLYDSTLRIVDQVVARGTIDLTVEVIPGISSVQVLAARHGIALHAIGGSVQITTGRHLARGWPVGVDDLVVMLDGNCTFAEIDPAGVDIYWGAYLGTDDEILISGPLAERAEQIEQVRSAARAEKGWIFDIYLLRRTGKPPAATRDPSHARGDVDARA